MITDEVIATQTPFAPMLKLMASIYARGSLIIQCENKATHIGHFVSPAPCRAPESTEFTERKTSATAFICR